MILTQHFSLEEFCATNHRNIDNTMPQAFTDNAVRTCLMLENIRARLCSRRDIEIPITLSSGYRSPELNRAVGSHSGSDHLLALAADWNAYRFGSPYDVCKELAEHVDELGIGQLIHEYGSWIHTSCKMVAKPHNRIITIDRYGATLGINRIR